MLCYNHSRDGTRRWYDFGVDTTTSKVHRWVEGHDPLEGMGFASTNSYLSQKSTDSKGNICSCTEAPDQKFVGIIEIGVGLNVGN